MSSMFGPFRSESTLARFVFGLGLPVLSLVVGSFRPRVLAANGLVDVPWGKVALAAGGCFFVSAYFAAVLALDDEEDAPEGWGLVVFLVHVLVAGMAYGPAMALQRGSGRHEPLLVWAILSVVTVSVGAFLALSAAVERSRPLYLVAHLPIVVQTWLALNTLAKGVALPHLMISGFAVALVLVLVTVGSLLQSAEPRPIDGRPWARVRQRIEEHQAQVRQREAGSLSVANASEGGELSEAAGNGALSEPTRSPGAGRGSSEGEGPGR